jgi:starch-binding outer membrane protein, SusD/RagB family
MKFKLSVIALIVALAGFTACDVVDVDPEQEIPTDLVFDDEDGARTAVTGMYGAVRFGNAYGGFPLIMGDIRGGNSHFVGSFTTWQDVAGYNISTTNSTVEGTWQANYEAINRANNVIESAPDVPDVTDEQIDEWVGNAHFVRAISLFNLVRWFGQPYGFTADNSHPGIPIVEDPTVGPGEQNHIPRSSVGEVYDQIISDLQAALENVPESYGETVRDRGRATTGSVNAFLARVYLTMSEWELAAGHAEYVIDSDMYSLVSGYTFFDDSNTSEDVFAIQMTTEDNPGTNAAFAAMHRPSPTGRGDINPSVDLWNSFDEEDERRTLYSEGASGTDLPGEVTAQSELDNIWTLKYTSGNYDDNVHVIRVAEMKLTRAEALAEMNSIDSEAIELLNDVRERAGLDAYSELDFVAGDDLVEAILQERRWEFAHEGHHYFDRLRRGEGLEGIANLGGDSIDYGVDNIVFPVPLREMDLNPELEQNPGY